MDLDTYKRNLAEFWEKCPKGQEIAAFRHFCRTDLYFLLRYGLDRSDMERQWLFDRCNEVVESPDGHIDLWTREHYKSTVITFGKTIQDILASHGEGAMTSRECTIGIFSHTRPIAKGFLRQIKLELERNEKLLEWFPDIIYANPQKESTKWSEDEGITVRRKGNPKECTVEAWGVVDGQPIGKHFTHLVYDDIVTRESTNTPEMINKTTEALSLSYNLGMDGGVRRFIGTRYHFNDSYKTIMDRGTAKPRIYPATDDGTMTGKAVLISQERLDEKRRDQGAYVYSCQMLQNPIADENQGFKSDWIQYHGGITDWSKFNVYILVDPANSKKSGSDYTAGWVIGVGEDQNYYVLDIMRDRLNLTQRAQLVMNWHRKYRPKQVRYEKYGMQADIAHIKHVQEQENYRFEITEVAGRASKPDRIKRLLPLFEKKRVYLPRSLHYTASDGKTYDLVRDFIEEEYKSFPVAIHDDMMDALARIEEPDLPLIFPKTNIYNSVVRPMPLPTYHRAGRGGNNRF